MKSILLVACLSLSTACTDTYDYDPATAGDTDGDRVPKAKTPSQFVRSVYSDLLGRSPETYDFALQINGQEQFRFSLDEEAQLVGTLDGIGDSQPLRNLITNGILHGEEVSLPDKASVDAKTFISEQFRKLLGRDPNTYELQVFANEWAADPAVGPRTVIRAIVGSREYQSQ